VVSFRAARNSAASEGGFVTVSGLALGTSDVTPTVLVGIKSCATSAWISTTSVACRAALDIARMGLVIAVLAGSRVGTQTSIFSFDGGMQKVRVLDAPPVISSGCAIEMRLRHAVSRYDQHVSSF
jgi:hypothetical protein